MGNYYALDALCGRVRMTPPVGVSRPPNLNDIADAEALRAYVVLCHLADPDGLVLMERGEIIELFRFKPRTFDRATMLLVQAGVVLRQSHGQPGQNGWRRIYRLVMPPRGPAPTLRPPPRPSQPTTAAFVVPATPARPATPDGPPRLKAKAMVKP